MFRDGVPSKVPQSVKLTLQVPDKGRVSCPTPHRDHECNALCDHAFKMTEYLSKINTLSKTYKWKMTTTHLTISAQPGYFCMPTLGPRSRYSCHRHLDPDTCAAQEPIHPCSCCDGRRGLYMISQRCHTASKQCVPVACPSTVH
jgi:hypothetical protein